MTTASARWCWHHNNRGINILNKTNNETVCSFKSTEQKKKEEEEDPATL